MSEDSKSGSQRIADLYEKLQAMFDDREREVMHQFPFPSIVYEVTATNLEESLVPPKDTDTETVMRQVITVSLQCTAPSCGTESLRFAWADPPQTARAYFMPGRKFKLVPIDMD